jgi:NADPH:quinone reductase-like Zn-dependent oxidoreductase
MFGWLSAGDLVVRMTAPWATALQVPTTVPVVENVAQRTVTNLGVGTFAVQLVSASGAHVIASVGSEPHVDVVIDNVG